MIQPHLIRLRGPWELTTTNTLTIDWSRLPELVAAAGACTLLRRFGSPTGISSGDRVELVIEGLAGVTAVVLNDVPLFLAVSNDQRFLLAQLTPRNELKLHLQTAATISPAAEVRLEIFSA